MAYATLVRLYVLLLVVLTTSGCQVVEAIFQAGIWIGIIMVLLVMGLVLFLVNMVRR